MKVVALTCGSRGSLLYSDGVFADHPGVDVEVVDTVGAGDAFTAAMAIGFLRGWDLETINARANRVAALVCSMPGATPEMPEGIKGIFLG